LLQEKPPSRAALSVESPGRPSCLMIVPQLVRPEFLIEIEIVAAKAYAC
jgi:hypothetical protein